MYNLAVSGSTSPQNRRKYRRNYSSLIFFLLLFLSVLALPKNMYHVHQCLIQMSKINLFIFFSLFNCALLKDGSGKLQLQEKAFPSSLFSVVFSHYWNHPEVIQEFFCLLGWKGRDKTLCVSLDPSCSAVWEGCAGREEHGNITSGAITTPQKFNKRHCSGWVTYRGTKSGWNCTTEPCW